MIDNPVSTVTANAGSGTLNVQFSPASPSVNIGRVPPGTTLNTTATRITTNTTTTLTSSTAYIADIAIITDVAGTGSTITVQDKSGSPLKLVDALVTTSATTTPTNTSYGTPLKMNGGIDIITGGVSAATVDIWVNYYQ